LAGDRWQESGLVLTTALGSAMDAGECPSRLRRALALVPGMNPAECTPTRAAALVSLGALSSDAGVPLEEISRLVGHSGTTVTELVYRHLLKPVSQTGATVMDQLFKVKADPA
jgi:integrase